MRLEPLGQALLLGGLLLALLGLLLMFGGRPPFLGRLPGDLHLRWGETFVFLPIATSLLVSVVLTLALNLALRFLNR
jgi:hypothetical protein